MMAGPPRGTRRAPRPWESLLRFKGMGGVKKGEVEGFGFEYASGERCEAGGLGGRRSRGAAAPLGVLHIWLGPRLA